MVDDGAVKILKERSRVLNKGKYNLEHDIWYHNKGELLEAAYAYMLAAMASDMDELQEARETWPFEPDGYKPEPDPVDNLVKAGQFIAAEIDRLQDGD